MTGEQDSGSTTITAGAGATIGIQSEQVHNSTVYQVFSDDPPEKKYLIGVNYLHNGVPTRALELINEAIVRGHHNAEVRFHWALAMLSKRSYRELSVDERDQLGRLPEHLTRFRRDEWTRALEALCELLAHLDSPGRDPASALTKLRNLENRQREAVTFHCDLVLTGAIKDSVWAESRREAEQRQHADNRANRVWAYFEPYPISARVRYPAPNSVTSGDWLRAVLGTALLAGSLGLLGWILLRHLEPLAISAYCAMLAGVTVAARAGFEWRYRTQRLRTKEREYAGRFTGRYAPEDGFADPVEKGFQRYAYKYAPDGVERSSWLADTRGIRTTLRDEVVDLYRESRVHYDRVRWLIRFLVRDVKRQWNQNLLFAYRQDYRTSLSTKVWFLAGTAIAVLATCVVVSTALRVNPLLALASVLIGAAGGRAAELGWWRIDSERRRCTEQAEEWARKKEAREAEYRRWSAKLELTRPSEDEMETWLRCDRALLVDEALRHYRLAWRDITAYTVVQAPVPGSKRARVHGGPWRYSKYELRLFLITPEGVRELIRRLNVERGTFKGNERGHFRFDAVSSLRVRESGDDYTLELTLSNGPTRTIDITEPERTPEQISLDEPGLAQISLDSTGFAHALHVLEGIAAEGKAWIQLEAANASNNRSANPGGEAAA